MTIDHIHASITGAPDRLRFKITGMDCPSCESKIETAVCRLPGVSDVRVNYQRGLLELSLDDTKGARERIEKQVAGLGYGITRQSTAEELAASGAEVGHTDHDGHNHEYDHGVEGDTPIWKTPKAQLAAAVGLLWAAGFVAEKLGAPTGIWSYTPAAVVGLIYCGRRAIAAAFAGSPFSIEMLMSVAVAGALFIGAASEAGVVVFLFAVGEMLEGLAARRARAGIVALSRLVPKTARLISEDGAVKEVSASSLEVGQLVLLRPGDRSPADGEITDGVSTVDESAITGESAPVAKQAGDKVFAGSINADGALQVRVSSAAQDNTIARVLHLVEQAQSAKSPTARFIDAFSARYTPAAFFFSVLVMTVPPLAGWGSWETWIYRGLALLLVACPCALVLSTPAAIASALATGARFGLLVKGGGALELIGRVRTVAFDKTGTLTSGHPQVTDVLPLGETVERALIGLAASVESKSSHPIALAIIAHAKAQEVPVRPVTDAKAEPGKSVSARVAGALVAVASPRSVAEGVIGAETQARIEVLESSGKTVVVVLREGVAIGLVGVRDEPRPDAAAGIAALTRMGVRSLMLSGDNQRTAAAIGAALGLEATAELMPQDKLDLIGKLKRDGKVAMIGDGINDAPALAAADVGIAMGGGTDVALETADASLLHNRVADVARLIGLSRAALSNIYQNIGVSLGFKALFLVTTLIGLTGLWPAILADTGATVLVTLNALRLLRWRPAV